MMTGRDLIIYILKHGLEDEPVFNDNTFIGFLTEEQFAEKMLVGVATVETWISLGYLPDIIRAGNKTFIPMEYLKWSPLRLMTNRPKRSEDDE